MPKISNNSIVKFWNLAEIIFVVPFGTGHINDTYKVKTEQKDYILQRINNKVFLTGKLVSNYQILARRIETYQEEKGIKITPEILKTYAGDFHHVDEDGIAWRLAEFIPNSVSYDISPDPSVSNEAAKAYGNYQLFLNTINPGLIHDTIPNFHSLERRFRAFLNACKTCEKQLFKQAEKDIERALGFKMISLSSTGFLKNLPVRVTHNDTKLNNVIFNGKYWFVIDLDTVMKSNIIFDFGDMVRTFTSPATEDEHYLDKVVIRTQHFEALARGYLEPLKDELGNQEKETLIYGAKYIIYEQALRFLTDYLNDNIYYKIDFPEHNLVRARTQLKLLLNLLSEEKKLTGILKSILEKE